jgi:lipoprotein-anchoring transpeptidase ErfK/SrfK
LIARPAPAPSGPARATPTMEVRAPAAPVTSQSTDSSAHHWATNTAADLGALNTYPRAVQSVFEMQVALARLGISPGSIDGLLGPQTRSALESFQQKERLPVTGELDNATRVRLELTEPPTKTYVVTSNDLACLQPLSPTWLGKSKQTALDYETLLELVSEKSHANPNLVRRLNPTQVWSNVSVCAALELPNVSYPQPRSHALFVNIRLGEKVLEAFDENTNLLVHFPCSIARQVEKRPIGELHVCVIAPHPNYTFDPEIFPESAEARELKTKLVLPPGPNSPVGLAWIGLDRPGYGIHGTANPEQVGRTESHGCFRLANWNAEYLARLVAIGTPVYIQP